MAHRSSARKEVIILTIVIPADSSTGVTRNIVMHLSGEFNQPRTLGIFEIARIGSKNVLLQISKCFIPLSFTAAADCFEVVFCKHDLICHF